MAHSNKIQNELNRQLALALFPEGCGIAPTSFEITGLGAKMDEIPRVKVEGLLEAQAMERLASILKAGMEALKPVTQAAKVPEGGYPMNTIPKTDFHKNEFVLLFMGGEWLRGGWNDHLPKHHFSSAMKCHRSIQWDQNNQPTAWKPL